MITTEANLTRAEAVISAMAPGRPLLEQYKDCQNNQEHHSDIVVAIDRILEERKGITG